MQISGSENPEAGAPIPEEQGDDAYVTMKHECALSDKCTRIDLATVLSRLLMVAPPQTAARSAPADRRFRRDSGESRDKTTSSMCDVRWRPDVGADDFGSADSGGGEAIHGRRRSRGRESRGPHGDNPGKGRQSG